MAAKLSYPHIPSTVWWSFSCQAVRSSRKGAPKGFDINLVMNAPNEQVPFMDRSHGFGVMRIVKWCEEDSYQGRHSDETLMVSDLDAIARRVA